MFPTCAGFKKPDLSAFSKAVVCSSSFKRVLKLFAASDASDPVWSPVNLVKVLKKEGVTSTPREYLNINSLPVFAVATFLSKLSMLPSLFSFKPLRSVFF